MIDTPPTDVLTTVLTLVYLGDMTTNENTETIGTVWYCAHLTCEGHVDPQEVGAIHANCADRVATSEHPCPGIIALDGTRRPTPCGADTIPPMPGTDEEGYYCPACGLVSE